MEEKRANEKQALTRRVVFFLVGAVVNYLLIATPFKYLRANTAMPLEAISACSMAFSTTFFFFWNYFINFRTDSRKRDAFGRYLTAVGILYVLSTTLLILCKRVKGDLHVNVGTYALDLDVVTVQLCLGWLKFIVYHKWAFPVAKTQPAGESASATAPVPEVISR